MKHLLALCMTLCALTACSEDPVVNHDGDPVDGPYTLALTGLTETCYDIVDDTREAEPFIDETFVDTSAEVDVYLRPDGLVDIRHRSNYLPNVLDGVIERIDRAAGADLRSVHQSREVASLFSTKRVTSIGRITPTAFSMDFTESYVDDSTDCTFTAHAEGFRRPIADAKALDGYYDVVLQDHVSSCLPATMDPAPYLDRVNVRRTVSGQLRVALYDGAIAFTVPMPPDGSAAEIAYMGELAMSSGIGDEMAPTTFLGSVSGGISPTDGVDLVLTLTDPDDADCTFVTEIKGSRMVPAKDKPVNDYRTTAVLDGPCLQEASSELGTASVRTSADGSLVLLDQYGGEVDIALDGTAFMGRAGDLASDGYEVSVRGTSAPPSLAYVMDIRILDPHGSDVADCRYTVTADGTARYVF